MPVSISFRNFSLMKMANAAVWMIGIIIALFVIGLIVGLVVYLTRKKPTQKTISSNSPSLPSSPGSALAPSASVSTPVLVPSVSTSSATVSSPEILPVNILSNGNVISPSQQVIQDQSGIALPAPGPSMARGTL